MLDQLKFKLLSQGIDTSTLRTLEDASRDSDATLKHISPTANEKQNPVYTLAVRFDDAIALWQRLRTLRDDTGYSPVILGDKHSLNHHWQQREGAGSPASYLKAADGGDAHTWFQRRWEEHFSDDETFADANLRRDWDTEATPFTQLNLSHLYPKGAPIQYIGFLPTTVNADLLAYLPFENWNDCPNPNEHVCIHRYWQATYDTEIIVVLFDTIVCRVRRPVKEPEAALNLAREWVAYCPDSVFQGTGTLGALAAGLINSTCWQFWWD